MRKAAFLGLVIGLVAVSATAEAAWQRGSTVTAYARAMPSFPATSPSRFSITTTNSGGPANAGVVNTGDKLVLTFTGSTVVPGSVVVGWNGSAYGVRVRFLSTASPCVTVQDGTSLLDLNVGHLDCATAYATSTDDFSTSTMTLANNVVTIRLRGGQNTAKVASQTLTWHPATNPTGSRGPNPTDGAGHPATNSLTQGPAEFF